MESLPKNSMIFRTYLTLSFKYHFKEYSNYFFKYIDYHSSFLLLRRFSTEITNPVRATTQNVYKTDRGWNFLKCKIPLPNKALSSTHYFKYSV